MNVIERRRLNYLGLVATSVRDNARIRDREKIVARTVAGQQSASHAGASRGVISAKIKSRTQIRRADKIELKMPIGFRRKSLLLNILRTQSSRLESITSGLILR
jgi:hypothetical protein